MQVAVRAILKDEVIKIGCFDDLIQSEYVLMDQISVNLDFSFQHFQIGPSKFFQFYHFYGVSFMYLLNLDSLVNLAAVSLSKLILCRIFIYSNFDFSIFERVKLL